MGEVNENTILGMDDHDCRIWSYLVEPFQPPTG